MTKQQFEDLLLRKIRAGFISESEAADYWRPTYAGAPQRTSELLVSFYVGKSAPKISEADCDRAIAIRIVRAHESPEASRWLSRLTPAGLKTYWYRGW